MSHHVYTTTTGQAMHEAAVSRLETFAALETLPGVPDESYAIGRCQAPSCGSTLYAWPRGLASLEDRAALRCVRCGGILQRTSRMAAGRWHVLPLRYLEATYATALERLDAEDAASLERLEAKLAEDGTSPEGAAYARGLRLEGAARYRKPVAAKLRKLRKLVAAEDKLAATEAAAKLVEDEARAAMLQDMERSAEDALQAAHEAARAAVEAADAAWLDADYVDADTEAARREAVDAALDARRETRSALREAGLQATPHVHHYASTSAAYDASQTDERVEDGDVLVCASEGAAAILVAAWPTAATEATAGEAFHVLADGSDWSALESMSSIGGRTDYSASALALASELAKLAEPSTDWPRARVELAEDGTATLVAMDADGIVLAAKPEPHAAALDKLADELGSVDVDAALAAAEAAEATDAEAACLAKLVDASHGLALACLAAWCGQCYGLATDMPAKPEDVLAALDARTLQTGGHGRRARQAAARLVLVEAMDAERAAVDASLEAAALVLALAAKPVDGTAAVVAARVAAGTAYGCGCARGTGDADSCQDCQPEASTEPHTAARSTLDVSPAAEDMDAERCGSCGHRADWHDAMDMACPDSDEPHVYSMAADAASEDEDEPAKPWSAYLDSPRLAHHVHADKLAAADVAAMESEDMAYGLHERTEDEDGWHALQDVATLVLDYREACRSGYTTDGREAADSVRLAIRAKLADMLPHVYADVPGSTLRLAGMPYVERQCSGSEDGWLYYVLEDGTRVEDAGGSVYAESAWHEAADLARLGSLATDERAAVETLRSAMQGSAEDAYGLAVLALHEDGWHVMEYREATASDGWQPERMRLDALASYRSEAAKLVDVDGRTWSLEAAALDAVAALEDERHTRSGLEAKLADSEATSQRLRETLAAEHARTLPDMRSADGSALVVVAGAMLPDGSVVVAGSASTPHVWHVLSMRPGWHAADTYRVATYARPSTCTSGTSLALYDGLAAALADYASRCELGTTEAL